MNKRESVLVYFVTALMLLISATGTAEAQTRGAWVEYQLPGDRPANWARMVGDNCLIFVDRDAPEIYAFDIYSAEWQTYTASTSLVWTSQIKVGRNVAFVYNDELAVAYTGLSQQFVPLSYSGTMLPGTTYGHDCETDMAYIVTDQYFYLFDGEDALWRSYDISGFGTVAGWGVYGMDDYVYLSMYAADESRKIVAYSYITKSFSEYNGIGYVQHQELQHGFVFYINSPPPDSLNHFLAGYSAYSGDYVSEMAPNHQPHWNSSAAAGGSATTCLFTDAAHVVDNHWRHDMWGFDTRHGNLVYSSYSYEYVCQYGIQVYSTSAGATFAVDSYRDCVSGELTYIVYDGSSNSFQTVLEEGLYYPTCSAGAHAQCGGEVFGASDCDHIWFFGVDNWLGRIVALPEPVDGYSNPVPQRMHGTWGIGECKRALSDEVRYYSYNKLGNSVQTQQVMCHTTPASLDSTNVGGVYAPYYYGDTIMLLYSPGTDNWLTKNLSTEGTAWGKGVQRDFIYYYDYGGSGPMTLFDGVTGLEVSMPFGWAYYSTANSRKYTWKNFMLVHSADDRYSGYSTYTRTVSEYPSEYLSSWQGQKDLAVAHKTISGGGADILAYNVPYNEFVMTSFGVEYGIWFDIWPGGKTALIMTLPGHLLAWDPNGTASGECCGLFTGGFTGNTTCDAEGKRNLADITRLIDRVYLSKTVLCCEENGNVDGDVDAKMNLADITRLIDHVYLSKAETEACE